MKRASHIPAPRAAACDDLHLRTSAQHWHVSTFCVIGNSPEFPVITSENTLREFPLVIATVAKVSRKRGLWLVVRVKKGDTRRYLHRKTISKEILVSKARYREKILRKVRDRKTTTRK